MRVQDFNSFRHSISKHQQDLENGSPNAEDDPVWFKTLLAQLIVSQVDSEETTSKALNIETVIEAETKRPLHPSELAIELSLYESLND